MRTYLTTAAVAALACPLPALPAAAQEEATVAEALEYLQREERPDDAPAERFLRQLDPDPSACRFHAEDRVPLPGGGFKNTCRFDPDPRPAAELDAFADRVAAVAADATLPDDVRWEATGALAGAASADGEGTPYPRAFDLLVEVYEGGYDDALIRIGGDRFPERGPAYVRKLFERSERPPLCHRGGGYPPADQPAECDSYSFWRDARPTPWCEAGGYLFGGIVAEAWERTPGGKRPGGAGYPAPYPEGLPEHVEDWHRRCR